MEAATQVSWAQQSSLERPQVFPVCSHPCHCKLQCIIDVPYTLTYLGKKPQLRPKSQYLPWRNSLIWVLESLPCHTWRMMPLRKQSKTEKPQVLQECTSVIVCWPSNLSCIWKEVFCSALNNDTMGLSHVLPACTHSTTANRGCAVHCLRETCIDAILVHICLCVPYILQKPWSMGWQRWIEVWMDGPIDCYIQKGCECKFLFVENSHLCGSSNWRKICFK